MVYSMKRYWPLEGVDLPFSPLLPLGLFCPLDTLLPLPGLLVLGVFFPAVSYIKVNIYDKQIWIRTFFQHIILFGHTVSMILRTFFTVKIMLNIRNIKVW